MRFYELPIYKGLIAIVLLYVLILFVNAELAFTFPIMLSVWCLIMFLGPSSNWCRGCYLEGDFEE